MAHLGCGGAYHNIRTFVLFISFVLQFFMPKSAPRALHKKAPRRQARGLRTREAILARAVDIASVQGLEGLTVGSLAEQLRMSKSGLFAHFGSKQDLQLATIEAARMIFIKKVTRPALAAPKGMPRLWGLVEQWLILVEKRFLRRV